MADRNWTGPQSAAIHTDGGSLLVSAAAGSGKTAVLVERAIRMICDSENPVPADALLVMTFSNAAAAEMKQRIGARLSSMIAQAPDNLHLQRQQALLQHAQISTVHSFCLDLIRQNFQYLDISPDFTLSDENEMAILEQDCARDVIEEAYESGDDEFFSLVELLSGGRDDRRLVEVLLRIYHFSRSHPFWKSWLDQKQEMYSTELPVAQTVWGHTILAYAVDSLEYCRETLQKALGEIALDEALAKGYHAAFSADLAQVRECLACAEVGEWNPLVAKLREYEFPRLGAVRGVDGAKERAKAARDRCKKILGDLAGRYLSVSEEEFRSDIAFLRPKLAVLFSLVKAFGDRLWEVKGEKKRLDFSDLEHLALQLLVEKDEDGAIRRTARAEEIALRYRTVMVDEYQDTNEVQDLIFTSVSDKQKNLFMVGDVKQSIYSFRQAMPEIFLRKKEVFFPHEAGQFPARINLDTNFRSRFEVTESVNFLFSLLMSEQIGEMNYTGEESLKCGATYPESDAAFPELLLYEKDPGAKEDVTKLEADAVAGKIAEMIESGYLVADGEGMRRAVPADFCILLRSPRGRAQVYQQALLARGVTAWTENASGFLQTREISAVVALLKALDNPLLDIELVAALLSPFFPFTDDDVARIRLVERGRPFFIALTKAAGQGDETARKFLSLFDALRTQAAMLPADKLLLLLYDKIHALEIARVMPLGESRAANLRLLVEYAATYHSLGYKRLGGFVAFLGRLEERGGDLAPAGTPGLDGTSGAVRIMSIHRSKGLEFPVVFLADTFRRFNKTDLYASTLLHSKYGFACVRRDEKTRAQYTTVPMQAIRLESERSLLSEEMRVLYVALTRAKEKLIVSGLSRGSIAKKCADLAAVLQEGRLPPYAVRECGCFADWVLMAMLHHESARSLRELGNIVLDRFVDNGVHWEFATGVRADAGKQEQNRQEVVHTAQPDRALLAHIQKRAAFVYPYEKQVYIPTKLAVSDVAKKEHSVEHRFAARPKFLTAQKLTPAEKGNAMHKFMQFSDYDNAQRDLAAEIRRMGDCGFLSQTETESLSAKKLAQFFEGPLAGRIFASKKVMRELKFMAECGQDVLGDYLEGMDEDAKVVLQGVADCVFLEDDGAVIVDYKTDAVKTPQDLADRYRTQLALYARILSDSLGAPVKECLLYSFHLGKTVTIGGLNFTNDRKSTILL